MWCSLRGQKKIRTWLSDWTTTTMPSFNLDNFVYTDNYLYESNCCRFLLISVGIIYSPHLFTFTLYVSLYLKWLSCWQQILGLHILSILTVSVILLLYLDHWIFLLPFDCFFNYSVQKFIWTFLIIFYFILFHLFLLVGG